MIRLDEARERIGAGVVYTPRGDPEPKREDGTVSSVGIDFVFVRYASGVMTTDPADLEWLVKR